MQTIAFQIVRERVSIRARPGGRAMRSIHRDDFPSSMVSIRARPGGRAMQGNVTSR